jgi:hypothetical protein
MKASNNRVAIDALASMMERDELNIGANLVIKLWKLERRDYCFEFVNQIGVLILDWL